MTKHLDLIESPTSDFSGVGKGQGTLFLVEFPDSNQYFSSLLGGVPGFPDKQHKYWRDKNQVLPTCVRRRIAACETSILIIFLYFEYYFVLGETCIDYGSLQDIVPHSFCRIKHFSFSRHTRGSVSVRLRCYR